MLYIFAGLPGAGKTTLARQLARERGAVHLRIDTIEQALRESGVAVAGPQGYVVAYRLAEDNLRLGLSVVADSVNPLTVTRAAWREVASRAAVPFVEIEVICSDPAEHRRRVEHRQPDIPGLRLPAWEDVTAREVDPWPEAHLVVDTAGKSPRAAAAALRQALANGAQAEKKRD